MSKERVAAGIKILGVYFLFVASEKFIALATSLILFRSEPRSFGSVLGAQQMSFIQALATRQSISLIMVSLFYFLAAFLCLKGTAGLLKICGFPDSKAV